MVFPIGEGKTLDAIAEDESGKSKGDSHSEDDFYRKCHGEPTFPSFFEVVTDIFKP